MVWVQASTFIPSPQVESIAVCVSGASARGEDIELHTTHADFVVHWRLAVGDVVLPEAFCGRGLAAFAAVMGLFCLGACGAVSNVCETVRRHVEM